VVGLVMLTVAKSAQIWARAAGAKATKGQDDRSKGRQTPHLHVCFLPVCGLMRSSP
jgi:hypothetical protein